MKKGLKILGLQVPALVLGCGLAAAAACVGAAPENGAAELVSDLAGSGFRFSSVLAGLSAGYEGNFWRPFEGEEEASPIVEYNAEALHTASFVGLLGYGAKPLLTVTYEMPINPSDRQREMFEAGASSESGLEKFTAGARLDPVADFFLGDRAGFFWGLARRTLSVRFRYCRELYWGDARTLRDSLYLPREAAVDYANRTISGTALLPAGSTIAFKADFRENEISIPVLSMDVPVTIANTGYLRISRHDLRVGYYASEWKRISDTGGRVTIHGKPVIYEGNYRSRGMMVSLETVDVGAPGINVDFSVRYGLQNTLETALDWGRFFERPVDENSVSFELGLWYNLYFGKDRDHGFYATVGGRFMKRAMNVDVLTEDGPETVSSRAIHDVDYLTKVFVTLGYRF